jgi:putative SOS response-associated peptidase YedK
MCFTVNVNLIKEELENRYNATLIDHDKYRPSYYYSAFALPELPAVCSDDPSKIRLLKWGLIPSWTKDESQAEIIRLKTFNARSDSLETKASFTSAFRSNRCIIPVAGFFEWQHTSDMKIPWYIYPSDDIVFSLAGIYDRWTETRTGEIISTFSIVTTEANELMAEIHNSGKRMPVILNKDSEKVWIDKSTSEKDALGLLGPCPSEFLKAHTISSLVTSKTANRNTPEVISPYSYYQQGNLLF